MMAIDSCSSCQHCGIPFSQGEKQKFMHRNILKGEEKINYQRLFRPNFHSSNSVQIYVCRKCARSVKSISKQINALTITQREDGETSSHDNDNNSNSNEERPRKRRRCGEEVEVRVIGVGSTGDEVLAPKSAWPAIRWLCRRKYANAIKAVAKIPVATEGLSQVMTTRIKQESRHYCQTMDKGPFRVEGCAERLEKKCPTLFAVMAAAAGPRNKSIKPRIAAAASLLFQSRRSHINAFQKLMGLLLWKGQLRSLMFRRLQFFGLVPSRKTVLREVDRMGRDYNKKTLQWKAAIEQQENMKIHSGLVLGATETIGDGDADWVDVQDDDLQKGPRENDEDDDDDKEDDIPLDFDHAYSCMYRPQGAHHDHAYVVSSAPTSSTSATNYDCNVSDIQMQDASNFIEVVSSSQSSDSDAPAADCNHDISLQNVDILIEDLHAGFQIIFDNVNITKSKRHKTSSNTNEQHNLVQMYSVLDRVNLEHLPNDAPISSLTSMKRESWWLPLQEQQALKDELTILVKRILKEYIPCFQDYVVQEHIEHEYAREAAHKSSVNKLGLLDKDEMKISDMIDIMSETQRYCPQTKDNRIQTIPFGGDGLSAIKAASAQKARCDGFTEEDRLEGLLPKAEDWHEGVIILQDIFTVFYNTKSVREKGTLYNLKELFNRRGVRKSAKDAVNDDREFITFTTHGYTVLAAMNILGIDNYKDSPADIPPQTATTDEKQKYLHKAASKIVDNLVFPCGVLPGTPTTHSSNKQDYKLNYVCSLMREGLLDIARIDAVREGDGERIIRHWRYDFVHFHAYNHPNYRNLAFRLIAQVYALLTPRMSARMVHNRTVNVHGGSGRNISLDIFLEFLNKDVKDDLKRSGPNLTNKLLERIGQSKQVLDELLHTLDRDMELFTGIGRHNKPDWSDDVSKMVASLQQENFFEFEEGRKFTSFPKFPKNKIHSMDCQKLEDWVMVQSTLLHAIT